MKFIIPFFLVVLLAACGTGEMGGTITFTSDVTTPTPVATPTPTPTPTPVYGGAIMVMGDSTMYGTQWDGQPLAPPSLTLSALLGNIPVDNTAVPGSTLDQLIYAKSPYYSQTLAQYVAYSKAQIVIENFGINDISLRGGETIDRYVQDLGLFVSIVKSYGKIPVLEEPNALCLDAGTNSMLDAYVAALRQYAQSNGVLLIAQYDALRTEYGANYCANLIDGIHPSRLMDRSKGRNEAGAVVGLLKTS